MWRALILGIALLPAAGLAFQESSLPVVDGDAVFPVVPKDGIPAIDDPEFVSAAEARDFMRDEEYVIGVWSGPMAKAYPVLLLDTHEIVNDRIGGVPVAVTWCPLCFTGIVYRREIAGAELTFGVSGRLWRENLVMYDRQTDSWWSQAWGRAIRGPHEGRELETYPSTMVTWREWRTLYPDSQVLSKRTAFGLEGMRDAYGDYHGSSRMGVTRSLRFGPSEIDRKARVVGFHVNGEPYVVPVESLQSNSLYEVSAGDANAIVVSTSEASTARVFRVEPGKWNLENAPPGRRILREDNSGAEWDAFTGEGLDPTDEALEPIPATLVYWFAWRAFYPESHVVR